MFILVTETLKRGVIPLPVQIEEPSALPRAGKLAILSSPSHLLGECRFL